MTIGNEKDFVTKLNWKKSFGVTHGTVASDWISNNLTEKELTAYSGPTDNEIKKVWLTPLLKRLKSKQKYLFNHIKNK